MIGLIVVAIVLLFVGKSLLADLEAGSIRAMNRTVAVAASQLPSKARGVLDGVVEDQQRYWELFHTTVNLVIVAGCLLAMLLATAAWQLRESLRLLEAPTAREAA